LVIQLTPDGFSIHQHDDTPVHVEWASVIEIFAFKVDCYIYDTIQLGFRVSDDGTYWAVNEDDTGYKELLAELESRFGLETEDWWTKVAYPAFATNRTTLWGEPSTEP
jgi:hypothetical protein